MTENADPVPFRQAAWDENADPVPFRQAAWDENADPVPFRQAAGDEFEHAVQRMAAITDAEQVADLCQATVDVLVAFDHWRSSPEWRDSPAAARLIEVVGSVREALAELPASPPLPAVLAAVTPLLNPWWPNDRGAAAEAVTAVEQLRLLAMTRTRAIADARRSLS